MAPTFSIVTPSFRQLDWLKLCSASVADQTGATREHLVQDAGTGAELETWAADHPGLQLFVEKDRGMYDAVNRGLRKTRGEILAYLNCDEQYLPGALAEVARFFAAHPEIEVAFAHAVVVDPEGRFISFRKAILPQKPHTLVSENLAILTCATFFRRSVVEQRQIFFDETKKCIGDGVWVMRLIDAGVGMAILPTFVATFTETGENQSLDPAALQEKAELVASAPLWARLLRRAIIVHYRLRKLLAGAYRQTPFSYAIYTAAQPPKRTEFYVENPSFRWNR